MTKAKDITYERAGGAKGKVSKVPKPGPKALLLHPDHPQLPPPPRGTDHLVWPPPARPSPFPAPTPAQITSELKAAGPDHGRINAVDKRGISVRDNSCPPGPPGGLPSPLTPINLHPLRFPTRVGNVQNYTNFYY